MRYEVVFLKDRVLSVEFPEYELRVDGDALLVIDALFVIDGLVLTKGKDSRGRVMNRTQT